MANTLQTARAALEDLMRRCREDAHQPTYADLQAVLARFPAPAPPPVPRDNLPGGAWDD
jgi:hypothetical protein